VFAGASRLPSSTHGARRCDLSIVGGETVPRAIDEIPIACALAARAAGTLPAFATLHRATPQGERPHRHDGNACCARSVSSATKSPTDWTYTVAKDRLDAADVASRGDHRIAMTAAVLALTARGPSRVRDAACIATSYPKFVATLRALGARVDVEE
jgi:3-phosphoshikimate 1-carboxyvinyltransferase